MTFLRMKEKSDAVCYAIIKAKSALIGFQNNKYDSGRFAQCVLV